MIKMTFHEDNWIDDKDGSIVLEVPFKKMVAIMSESVKAIASGKENNPIRLYASNVYTSLSLLSRALNDEDISNVKELLHQPAERKDGRSLVLEATIIEFMKNRSRWSGTHTDLLRALKEIVPPRTRKFGEWPKSPNSLSYRLKQSEAPLLKKGVEVSRVKSSDERTVTLEKVN